MISKYSIRLDSVLKTRFFEFCRARNISVGQSIALLNRSMKENNKLPFSLYAPRAFPESKKDIRVVINLSKKICGECNEFFSRCDELCLPISTVLRAYMNYCVENNHFPFDIDNDVLICSQDNINMDSVAAKRFAKAIGNFIVELRIEQGIARANLAKELGISDNTILMWESGEVTPNVIYLNELGRLLNVTVNELLAGKRIG